MTLREYIENLSQLAQENPEVLDLQVIYAKDSEGNGFSSVYYSPSIGVIDDDGDFYSDLEEDEQPNAVCIN